MGNASSGMVRYGDEVTGSKTAFYSKWFKKKKKVSGFFFTVNSGVIGSV